MHLTRRTVVVAALITSSLLTGCSVFTTAIKSDRQIVRETEAVPGIELLVETRNGAIEIVVDETRSSVGIDTVITCSGTTQVEADQRVADASLDVTLGTDRVLSISPVFPGERRRGDGAKIVVRLPEAASITARTGNGKIDVTGGEGTLVADTSNGPIRIDGFVGPITADTSNGAVVAHNVHGVAKIDTSNGRVTLTLHEDCTDAFEVETSNGSVDVTVGASFEGTIEARTSNGSIDIVDATERIAQKDQDRSRALLTIGSSSAQSTITTRNGSVRINLK